MPGIITLSSSCPACAPHATVVSLPMTWKQTWFTISAIAGFTLPGMIDEPGWTAGMTSSPNPVRGPDTRMRMSLQIWESSIDAVRIPLEIRAKACGGAFDARTPAADLLAERDRHRVLQMSPPRLHDVGVLRRLRGEHVSEL